MQKFDSIPKDSWSMFKAIFNLPSESSLQNQ
jgi:hypothetical protein